LASHALRRSFRALIAKLPEKSGNPAQAATRENGPDDRFA
jgi:hypothetical protein